MKRLLLLLTSLALLWGCQDQANKTNGTNNFRIGVSMPTQSLQRWNQDGANMKGALEAAGFKVDLQYAGNNDIPTQVAQIENMISSGVDVLVIAAIDGNSLAEVLKQAQEKGIVVIAYDRLLMNTDAVSYYATFDNNLVGVMQGEYIVDRLGLTKGATGPFNIELITGDPADSNTFFYYGGAMSVLKPYLDSGKLVIPSGQVTLAQVATPNWSTENAQRRFENLITSVGYGPNGKKLDAVLASNDSTANGVTNALINAGYTAANFPLLTGQDADRPSVKNMVAGTQSMSIFKDTRALALKVTEMIKDIQSGNKVDINDTTTYNNGVKVVPAYLLAPVILEKDGIQTILIDSGYYKASEIS